MPKFYDDDAMNAKKKGKGLMGDIDLMMGGSFGDNKKKGKKKKPIDEAFGGLPKAFDDY